MSLIVRVLIRRGPEQVENLVSAFSQGAVWTLKKRLVKI